MQQIQGPESQQPDIFFKKSHCELIQHHNGFAAAFSALTLPDHPAAVLPAILLFAIGIKSMSSALLTG